MLLHRLVAFQKKGRRHLIPKISPSLGSRWFQSFVSTNIGILQGIGVVHGDSSLVACDQGFTFTSKFDVTIIVTFYTNNRLASTSILFE